MKVLLIEDDPQIGAFIQKGLKQEAISCDHATDGLNGYLQVDASIYDVLIVDLMLPTLDGISIIRKLREQGVPIPILILSAKASVDDRVTGLGCGADDYLVKPFAFSELLARLQALVRRAGATVTPTALDLLDLNIDLAKRRVERDGTRLELQPTEYGLLVYLAQNMGRVVSKTMIMEHVWDYNFDPGTNVVEACICRLRDKVDRPFGTKLIHTVRGFGYVFETRD
ncbi:DNA-binding response regulator [bacterium M21]|nr:DNA-binding response regulator [bacterium M21]